MVNEAPEGTVEYGFMYGGSKDEECIWIGCVDSDFAGHLDKRIGCVVN